MFGTSMALQITPTAFLLHRRNRQVNCFNFKGRQEPLNLNKFIEIVLDGILLGLRFSDAY
jgi:hypothetical protein